MKETDISYQRPDASFSVRAAALIIQDGKLLVAKSAGYPCYYTIGGTVKLNETSVDAVIRELYEETGFTLEIDKLAFVQERFLQVNGQKCHEIVFFYIMKVNGDFSIMDNSFTDQAPKETLHWLPLDELRNINLVPAFLKTQSFDHITTVEHIISKEI